MIHCLQQQKMRKYRRMLMRIIRTAHFNRALSRRLLSRLLGNEVLSTAIAGTWPI